MFNRNDSKPTELQLLKADLISPEIKILLDSEEVYSNLINNRTMQESESPDIIITKDNKCIGLEVFEFSSYLDKNKAGNTVRLNESKIKKEALEKYRMDGTNYFLEHVATNNSLDNYEKNFIKNFGKHYNKIEDYLLNMQKFMETNNYKQSCKQIYFLIKDVSNGGNMINNNGKTIPYYPLMNKKIIEYLMNKRNVKGLIFEYKNAYNVPYFLFFKNTKKNLKEIKSKNKIYFGIQLNNNSFNKVISIF